MGRRLTSIVLLVLVLSMLTAGMILAASPEVTNPGELTLTDLEPVSDTVPAQTLFFKSHGPEGCGAFGQY